LGLAWRWAPRARLGDGTWAAALAQAWPGLSQPLRIQGLEAAGLLPAEGRTGLKEQLRPWAERAGGPVQRLWEAL